MTKILLISSASGREHSEPLAGAAGARLAALANMCLPDFLALFERRNLLDEWSGSEAKGDIFPLAEARARADEMRQGLKGRRVVLFGRGVANAFRLISRDQAGAKGDYDWFEPIEVDPGFECAVVPHPSGVARWWNEPENVVRAQEFVKRLRLGCLAPARRRRGKDRFTVAEVNAALEAGRGVYSWAAEYLAETTGLSCCPQTIRNYVKRYSDEIDPVMARTRAVMAGGVVKGIMAKAEAGELAALKELAGYRFVQDAALEHLGLDLRKSVGVDHSGNVKVGVEVVHRAELEAMSPAEKARRYREVVRGECRVVSIDDVRKAG